MEPALLAVAAWLDAMGVRTWSGSQPWAYPVANVLHIVGLVMLIGGIGIVDLRLIGFWRAIPTHALSRALTPLAIAGLLIQLPSGLVLFAADGTALASSAVFQAKLTLIALALLNAAGFRRFGWMGTGDAATPPRAARASATL